MRAPEDECTKFNLYCSLGKFIRRPADVLLLLFFLFVFFFFFRFFFTSKQPLTFCTICFIRMFSGTNKKKYFELLSAETFIQHEERKLSGYR